MKNRKKRTGKEEPEKRNVKYVSISIRRSTGTGDTERGAGKWNTSVFLTTSKECKDILCKSRNSFDGDVELKKFISVRLKHNRTVCMEPLCVPRLLDVLGSRYKLQFFINEKYIVIADNDDFGGTAGTASDQTKAAAGPDEGTVFYIILSQNFSTGICPF